MAWGGGSSQKRSFGSKRVTKKDAAGALTCLLWGCRPEMLAGFTAQSLAGSYNVTVEQAQRLLDGAREGRANG